MHSYHSLERTFARLGAIHDAIGILQWDTETMMPDGAVSGRSEQLATLKGIAHDLLTAREVGDFLDEAEQDTDSLTEWQHANVREMRRIYLHASAVPVDLIQASSRAVSRAEMA